jgi:monoamine oxidase
MRSNTAVEARADFDGYIAEVLSKALSQAQIDQPLTTEGRDRLSEGLSAWERRRMVDVPQPEVT